MCRTTSLRQPRNLVGQGQCVAKPHDVAWDPRSARTPTSSLRRIGRLGLCQCVSVSLVQAWRDAPPGRGAMNAIANRMVLWAWITPSRATRSWMAVRTKGPKLIIKPQELAPQSHTRPQATVALMALAFSVQCMTPLDMRPWTKSRKLGKENNGRIKGDLGFKREVGGTSACMDWLPRKWNDIEYCSNSPNMASYRTQMKDSPGCQEACILKTKWDILVTRSQPPCQWVTSLQRLLQ